MPTLRQMNYDEWLLDFSSQWQQGQHIALIGPTGSGKTTVARTLLSIRQYVAVIAIKLHDDSLTAFKGRYTIITKWPPPYGKTHVVYWTKPEKLGGYEKQRNEVMRALESIYLSGGWCVYFDDLSYVCDVLRIKTPIVTFLNQGRSSGISAVSAATRPRKVPTEAFNQSSHFLVWRYNDLQDVWRCAEIVGISRQTMVQLLRLLRPHEFVAFSGNGEFITIVRNSKRAV